MDKPKRRPGRPRKAAQVQRTPTFEEGEGYEREDGPDELVDEIEKDRWRHDEREEVETDDWVGLD